MLRLPLALVGLTTLAAAVACSSDEGESTTTTPPPATSAGSGGSTTTTTSAGGMGTGGMAATCETPFTPEGQDAFIFGGAFGYIGQSTTMGSPVDTLEVEFLAGAPEVGTVPITDGQYATCQVCVLWKMGCDENLSNCDKTYIADSGTFDITASGSTFEGTLQDANFVEVTIDGDNNSTPVAGSDPVCWDSYAFSTMVQGG